MNPNFPNKKKVNILKCESCNFTTSRESNFNSHLMTRKHEILTNPNRKMPSNILQNLHGCSCGKEYKHLSSLCAHKKKCSRMNILPCVGDVLYINKSFTDTSENKDKYIELLIKENADFKNIILDIVKSNSELQKQLVNVCKNVSNTTINSHNNNNNKTFNLQFFLNEQCKDAMNISEFVNSFDLQLSDLESVGDLGYVEGMTKIFLDKLNSMDIYKRPIHCSDAKREILYIKDENIWSKELRNNPKLRYAIKTLSFKNMKLANLWSDTYPESKNNESHLNDVYMKLVIQSTGGSGEICDSEDKIMRRIAKEIVIDKTTF